MSLPQELKNHCLLNCRKQGASKVLLGDVVIVTFLINDSKSHWTEEAENEYLSQVFNAVAEIEDEAKKRNINLNIKVASCQLTVNCNCSNKSTDWIKEVMSLYKQNSASNYQEYFEDKYDFDEAPVIFALNKNHLKRTRHLQSSCRNMHLNGHLFHKTLNNHEVLCFHQVQV